MNGYWCFRSTCCMYYQGIWISLDFIFKPECKWWLLALCHFRALTEPIERGRIATKQNARGDCWHCAISGLWRNQQKEEELQWSRMSNGHDKCRKRKAEGRNNDEERINTKNIKGRIGMQTVTYTKCEKYNKITWCKVCRQDTSEPRRREASKETIRTRN